MQRPGNLKLSKWNQAVMDELYNDPHMKRLIRWGNGKCEIHTIA